MELISNILSGLLAILAGLLIWWEYRLKYHPIDKDGRTVEHKSRRKFVLWVALVLIGLNFLSGHIKDNQSKTEQDKLVGQISSLNTNQTNLVQRFDRERQELNSQISLLSNQLTTINSNQANLSKENQRLVIVLSTNTAINSTTRAAIIESTKRFELIDSQLVDVNAWAAELANKRARSDIEREQTRQRSLEAEKPIIEECLPGFDYAVKRLQLIFSELAKQMGERVFSNYVGIPSTLQSNIVTVADITIGTNSLWNFTVSIQKQGRVSRFFPPLLSILCNGNGVNLRIRPRAQQRQLNTDLVIPNEQPINSSGSLDDFKEAIDEALRNLIAVQSEQMVRTNR